MNNPKEKEESDSQGIKSILDKINVKSNNEALKQMEINRQEQNMINNKDMPKLKSENIGNIKHKKNIK